MPGLFGMEAAEHTMIYRNWIPGWIRWAVPTRLKVVTTLSAGQYFGAVRILAGTDHFTAVKPDSVHHPAHEFLIDFAIAFRAASDKLHLPTRAREPTALAAVDGGERPSDSHSSVLANSSWPAESDVKLPVHGFVAEAGVDSDSDTALVGCVIVEDLKDFESRFEAGIVDMEQDPYFRALPDVMAALRARELLYKTVDPDLRARITELLPDLIFEAYVCFAKRQAGISADGAYNALRTNLLFQRLRASGSRPVTLSLAPALQDRARTVRRIVEDCVERIKRLDRQRSWLICA